jgi:LacI family transcriptional regulator
LTIAPELQIDLGEADRREGTQAAATILRLKIQNPPTAWICMTGLMARGATNFLLQQGIDVGNEVSVVAFDLTKVCTEEHPTITSAFAEPTKIGEEAGRIVLAASSDNRFPLHEITLPSVLVERESSGPAPKTRKGKPVSSKTKS